jgi:hypothetical protein
MVMPLIGGVAALGVFAAMVRRGHVLAGALAAVVIVYAFVL